MRKRIIFVLLGAVTCFAGSPEFSSQAHAQATELKVKKNKSYKHPHSKIKLPAVLTGYARDYGRSFFSNELDVSFQYTSDDRQDLISIYIFRKTNADTSVWFDRAKDSIEQRDVFGDVVASSPPKAFGPMATKNASGMRVSYSATGGKFASTGLMLIPVNGWYVKLRASSVKRTADEIDQWMDLALTEIIWPKKIVNESTATPIAVCEDALFFSGEAKAVESSLENSMLSGLLGATSNLSAADSSAGEAVSWCRDDGQKLFPSAIYRANGSKDSYLFALGDAGRAISTGINGLSSLIKSETAENANEASPAKEYSVTLHIPDKQLSFVERDRLPSPEELMKIIESESPTSATNNFGQDGNITIFTEEK